MCALQAGFQLVLPKEDASSVWLDRGGGEKWLDERSQRAGFFAHLVLFERLREVAQLSDRLPTDDESLWTALLSKDSTFASLWKDAGDEERADIFAM